MLESGRDCISCGQKKYLKDFPIGQHVCHECVTKERIADSNRQNSLGIKYNMGHKEVSICDCRRLYNNRNGHYKECELCRSQETSEQMERYTTPGLGEQFKALRKEGSESERIESGMTSKSATTKENEKNTIATKSIAPKKELDIQITEKEIEKDLMNTKKNTTTKTGRSTMQGIENDTTNKENTDLVSSGQAELEEIPCTVTVNLSNNLRQENSSSISMLTGSAELLTSSAKALLMDEKGDFGEGAIRRPTMTEADMALRLALGANEMMKTKLEYIKTGKSLINDMHELLADEDEE